MALATKRPTADEPRSKAEIQRITQHARDVVAKARKQADDLTAKGTPEARKEAKKLRLQATLIEKRVKFFADWLAEGEPA